MKTLSNYSNHVFATPVDDCSLPCSLGCRSQQLPHVRPREIGSRCPSPSPPTTPRSWRDGAGGDPACRAVGHRRPTAIRNKHKAGYPIPPTAQSVPSGTHINTTRLRRRVCRRRPPGRQPRLAQWPLGAVLASRLAHMAFYYANRKPMRSLSFAVSLRIAARDGRDRPDGCLTLTRNVTCPTTFRLPHSERDAGLHAVRTGRRAAPSAGGCSDPHRHAQARGVGGVRRRHCTSSGSPHPTADRAAVDPPDSGPFRYERLSPARRPGSAAIRHGLPTRWRLRPSGNGGTATTTCALLPRHEISDRLERATPRTRATVRDSMAYLSPAADRGSAAHPASSNPAAGHGLSSSSGPSSAAIRQLKSKDKELIAAYVSASTTARTVTVRP